MKANLFRLGMISMRARSSFTLLPALEEQATVSAIVLQSNTSQHDRMCQEYSR